MVRPSIKQKGSTSKGIGSVIVACVFVGGFFLGHIHAGLTNQAQENSLRADVLSTTPPPINSAAAAKSYGSSGQSGREYGNGWHSIEVFYGKTDHLEKMLPPDLEWFSQARQDEVVTTLLKGKRNGYFVDLAANDATVLSNTYSLEKKFGWTGLCVEPNPVYWANLTYRDCQVVAAVAGNERMEEVYFRDAGDKSGMLGFDNGYKFQKESRPRYTVTLTEILTRFNAPKNIDYLSLDVEGAEEFIMQHFPLKDYTISVMTVERPQESLRALFEKNGFKFITRLTKWGETLWAHESVMDSLDLSTIQDFNPKNKPKQEATVIAEAG
mmetsp:Transcript_23904/g.39539  ORF Transcript_23904/g.39539 Transcript_23904/m.39539 type:complete len:325 (-) Transcript_23904:41-1015(-)